MKEKRISQWIMLAVVCLSFSVGETFAQERDFANSARFAKENAALPKPSKKENIRNTERCVGRQVNCKISINVGNSTVSCVSFF